MSILSFDQLASLAVIRQVYYLAWRLFGVNIALISPDRKRTMDLGATERWSSFCLRLRQMGGEKHCLDCDHEYVTIVWEKRRPLRYRCWAGLREFIVPIILDGDILAFIQCGQVLDSQPGSEDWFSTCRKLMALGIEKLPPDELYYSLQVIPPKMQEDLMSLLELFGNYIASAQYQILLAEASQQSRAEERALSFIRNHFTSEISLDDVAEAACVSKRNLARIFQANTGKTVLSTIHEMRIARACRLLQAGKMTCTQVAFECGFGSVQQFNRVFQKLRQCTPHAWQQRFQETGRLLSDEVAV